MDADTIIFAEPAAGQDMQGMRLLADMLAEPKQERKTLITINMGQKLSVELLCLADTLIPNETEPELLTGLPANTLEQVEQAAKQLIAIGVQRVLCGFERAERRKFLIDNLHYRLFIIFS